MRKVLLILLSTLLALSILPAVQIRQRQKDHRVHSHPHAEVLKSLKKS